MEVYDLIIYNLDTMSKIKLIKLYNKLSYYILNKSTFWETIKIYNNKEYPRILDFLKTLNDSPKVLQCISSEKIKLNLEDWNLKMLNHIDLSNSKIKYENLLGILYNSKLEKLYLKRIKLYNINKHIITTQKKYLRELDLSTMYKFRFERNNWSLFNIEKIQNLRILKINNIPLKYHILMNILSLKYLELLEMKYCYINSRWGYCCCSDIKNLVEKIVLIKKVVLKDNFCNKTMDILKYHHNNLIII